MKEKVTKLANARGCSTHYDGKTRTMYIRGANRRKVAAQLKGLFPFTDFKITYNL